MIKSIFYHSSYIPFGVKNKLQVNHTIIAVEDAWNTEFDTSTTLSTLTGKAKLSMASCASYILGDYAATS